MPTSFPDFLHALSYQILAANFPFSPVVARPSDRSYVISFALRQTFIEVPRLTLTRRLSLFRSPNSFLHAKRTPSARKKFSRLTESGVSSPTRLPTASLTSSSTRPHIAHLSHSQQTGHYWACPSLSRTASTSPAMTPLSVTPQMPTNPYKNLHL